MSLFIGYSKKFVSTAFISTILYLGLFIFFKAGNYLYLFAITNLLFATFCGYIFLQERLRRIDNENDSRLLAISTSLAPIAATVIDAMLTVAQETKEFKLASAAAFLLITFSAWLFISFFVVFLFKLTDKK